MIPDSKREVVLIVDDSPENIRVLNEILEHDYQVLFATNGGDALELAIHQNPDLILLDIMLPGMDGYEVCTRLKESEKAKEIPIIFLTGKRETENIKKGFDSGAVDYITKPFNRVELLVRVKNHLKLKRSEEALKVSRKKYIDLYNNAPDMYLSIDVASGVIIDCNQRFIKELGYSSEEIIGMPVFDLYHPHVVREVRDRILPMFLITGLIQDEELKVVKKDGSVMDVSLNASAIRNEEGEIIASRSIWRNITERIKAEEQIKILARFPDSNPNPVLRVSSDLTILYANKASLTILLDMCSNLKEYHNSKQLPAFWRDTVDEVLKTGKAKDKDVNLTNRVYRFTVTPVADINCVYLYGKDITETIKAEEVLRQYEVIVSASSEHMSLIDMNYTYKTVNEVYLRAHKKQHHEIVGHRVPELLGNKFFEENIKREIDRCLAGEEVNYQKWFNFHGTGTRYMDVYYYPVFEKDGSVSAMVVNSRDITNQKIAEDTLRESEERFRKIFEEGPLGMSISDLDYKFLKVNTTLCQMVGYSEEELLGKSFDIITHSEDLEAELPLARKLTVGEIPYLTMEKRYIKKNGILLWINLTATAIRDQNGEIMYYLAMMEDISGRKEAEESVQLSLKEKALLLQEIHHRVKNNLQVIVSLIGLQMVQVKDKKYAAMFLESQSRIKSMAIIHEKLYRTEDMTHIDFNNYVTTLLDEMFVSYGVDRKRISCHLDTEEIYLEIDTAIPVALITNELVSNSLKYAFEGSERGTIKISIRKMNENEYDLIISDNGSGIPEDIDFRKTKSLGLHIVTTLVKQIYGQILLDRSKGTEFKISFKTRNL